jgi:hypothetical protein
VKSLRIATRSGRPSRAPSAAKGGASAPACGLKKLELAAAPLGRGREKECAAVAGAEA